MAFEIKLLDLFSTKWIFGVDIVGIHFSVKKSYGVLSSGPCYCVGVKLAQGRISGISIGFFQAAGQLEKDL